MVSIRESLSELEKVYELQQTLLDTYVMAIRTVAQYAVEIDDEITPAHRQHLTSIAAELTAPADAGRLADSRALLRNELRDYRDRAAGFLSALRADLSARADALQAIVEAMASADGDHEEQLQDALAALRNLAGKPAAEPVRAALLEAAGSIETSIDRLKQQNSLTVGQFMVEIKTLHKRIETLEAAGRKDVLTGLHNRVEMETRIAAEIDQGQPFSLILLRVCNLPVVLRQFGAGVRMDVISAFAKRMVNALPAGPAVGRWSEDRFMILLGMTKTEAIGLARNLVQHVAGTYVCMDNGKPQRPSLVVDMSVVDHPPGSRFESLISRLNQL